MKEKEAKAAAATNIKFDIDRSLVSGLAHWQSAMNDERTIKRAYSTLGIIFFYCSGDRFDRAHHHSYSAVQTVSRLTRYGGKSTF